MRPEEISFDEAERILRDHGGEFRVDPDVNAIGIAERDNGLRFVVSVQTKASFDRLGARLAGREIEGFPVWVERAEMVALDGGTREPARRIWNDDGTPVHRQTDGRWIIGGLIAAVLGLVAVAALSANG